MIDYKVKVRNHFKGLNMIDRVPDELWAEVRANWTTKCQSMKLQFCLTH